MTDEINKPEVNRAMSATEERDPSAQNSRGAAENSSQAAEVGSGGASDAQRASAILTPEVTSAEGPRRIADEANQLRSAVSEKAQRAAGQIYAEADEVVSQSFHSGSRRLRTLLAFVPAMPVAALAALGAVALVFAIWWMQHNAQLRSEGALREIQRQTNVEVSGLEAKAAASIRDANQTNAKVISDLLVARGRLEQQARDLNSRFEGLQQQEQTHRQEIALLGAPEVWKRLGEQLGAGAIGEKESEVRSQESEGRKPESRNQNGEANRTGQNSPSKIQNLNSKISASDSCLLTPDSCSLTEAGARKVVQSLSELSSCREESRVQTEQLSSCQQQTAANAQIAAVQKSSIARLNEALAEKDQILAKRQAEFKTELRVARGTVLARVARLGEHVAIGVAIGWVLRTR